MSGSPKEDIESPSSRRAWIEMLGTVMDDGAVGVALLAEGVDRNLCRQITASGAGGRPPRGGRG